MSTENVGQAIYTAEVDTTKLNSELAGAEAKIKETGAATEKAFSEQGSAAATKYGGVVGFVQGQFNNLKSQLSAPAIGNGILQGVGLAGGLAAFNLVKMGVEDVVGALSDSVKAYEESQVADAKLATALKDNVPNYQNTATAIDGAVQSNMKLGFTTDQTKNSLATLVTFTKNVNEAMMLQATAEDLARAKGIDLQTASTILGKVYEGNVGVLTRYGIAVQKGATASQALADIQKAVGGQAEAYSQTLEGQQAAIDAEANAIQIKIGQVAQPIMKGFFDFLLGPGMDALNGLMGGIGNVGDAFNNINRFLNPATAALQDFTKAAEDQAQALGISKDAIDQYITSAINAQQTTQAAVQQINDQKTLLGQIGQQWQFYANGIFLQTNAANAQEQQQQKTNAAIQGYMDDQQESARLTNNTSRMYQEQADTLAAQQQAYLANSATMRASEQADAQAAQIATNIEKSASVDSLNNQQLHNTAYLHLMDQLHTAAIANATAMGKDIPKALSDAMTSSQSTSLIANADADLQNILKNGLTPKQEAMQAIGVQNVKLIEKGMASEIPGAVDAARATAVASIKAISDAGLQGAAGQKGLETIGKLYDDLLASGMSADEAKAALQAANVSRSVIDSLGGQQQQNAAHNAGVNLAQTYLGGFKAGADAYDYKAMLNTIDNHLHGASPPPEGPLHDIDKWGEAVGEAWLGGFGKGIAGIGAVLSGTGSAFTAVPALASGGNSMGDVHVTVNVTGASDAQGTADAVGDKIRNVFGDIMAKAHASAGNRWTTGQVL
jgi:hypothetical protein